MKTTPSAFSIKILSRRYRTRAIGPLGSKEPKSTRVCGQRSRISNTNGRRCRRAFAIAASAAKGCGEDPITTSAALNVVVICHTRRANSSIPRARCAPFPAYARDGKDSRVEQRPIRSIAGRRSTAPGAKWLNDERRIRTSFPTASHCAAKRWCRVPPACAGPTA